MKWRYEVSARIEMMVLSGLLSLAMFAAVQAQQVINFDKDVPGKVPAGFTTGLTGKGKPGVWTVMKDPTAPSPGNVLAQSDEDATGYRFPVCVYDAFTARDVDVSVKFKPIRGEGDQAAGIVWRFKDFNNYYIVRANALEGNVVLYKVENGRRTDLPLKGAGRTYGVKTKVLFGQWGTLRITAKGNVFEVYHDGKKLFEVEDTSFPGAGKVGLWTKADSYTLFDDLIFTKLGN